LHNLGSTKSRGHKKGTSAFLPVSLFEYNLYPVKAPCLAHTGEDGLFAAHALGYCIGAAERLELFHLCIDVLDGDLIERAADCLVIQRFDA
jgi:hypothetical protein